MPLRPVRSHGPRRDGPDEASGLVGALGSTGLVALLQGAGGILCLVLYRVVGGREDGAAVRVVAARIVIAHGVDQVRAIVFG